MSWYYFNIISASFYSHRINGDIEEKLEMSLRRFELFIFYCVVERWVVVMTTGVHLDSRRICQNFPPPFPKGTYMPWAELPGMAENNNKQSTKIAKNFSLSRFQLKFLQNKTEII